MAEGFESRWLAARDLARLAESGRVPSGHDSLQDILARTPELLLSVSEPALHPLNIATYRVRHERWLGGEGPEILGMDEFMHALETGDEPLSVVAVAGDVTNYVLLLDETLSRVVVAVAIEPRGSSPDP